MHSRTKFSMVSTYGATFAAVLLLSPSIRAQPNPFDDYAQRTQPIPSDTKKPDPSDTEKPAKRRPKEVEPTIVTKPLAWSVGLRSQFAFSSMKYERAVGGQDGVAKSGLFRLSPSVALFVYDRVQIGFSPGFLARSGGGSPGDTVTDTALLLEATAHYFAPVTHRLSFVPGIGLGGSIGGGLRSIDVAGSNGAITRKEFKTTSGALSLALHAGVAYQLTNQVQIRSGLFLHCFFNRDTLEGKTERMSGVDTHIGIPIDVFYTF